LCLSVCVTLSVCVCCSLTVCLSVCVSQCVFASNLKEVAKQYPQLSISLSTHSALLEGQSLIDALVQRRFHLVLSVNPDERKEITSITLFNESFYFYSKQNLLNLDFKDLAKFPIIWVPTAIIRKSFTLENAILEMGIQPRKSYAVDNFESVKALALQGLGIAILPSRVALGGIQQNTLKALKIKNLSKNGFGKHQIKLSIRIDDKDDLRIKNLISLIKA